MNRHCFTSAFAHFVLAGFGIAASIAQAHEFWLTPLRADPPAHTTLGVVANVGEYFRGDAVPFTAERIASIFVHSASGARNIGERFPSALSLAALPVAIGAPGTYIVAYDTTPSFLELDGGRFNAYLHDEGLDPIVRYRELGGAALALGRERYRRSVKTIVNADGRCDATWSTATGQRIEIVPQSDPCAAAPGATLSFQLLFDASPLPGHLAKAWFRRDGQTFVVRAIADEHGIVAFTLPFAGPWMVSTVRMIRADADAVDWDSWWASLTFDVAAHSPSTPPASVLN